MFDLKEFRRVNKLTQSKMGVYLGVEQSFISQIEMGKRPLPNEFISKIEANDKFIVTSTMTDFELFVKVNNLKKKDIATYLNVSSAFITQLVQGIRSVPDDKLALLNANLVWNSSMLREALEVSKNKPTTTMQTSVKERLIVFIKYKKLSQSKFEKIIGTGNGFVNNISKSIGGDKLQSILYNFPELNTGWLISGEGEMLKKNTNISENAEKSQDVISIPADVWAVISNQAESLKEKDKQTSLVIELLKEQLKKSHNAEMLYPAANIVVEEDE